MIDSNEEHRAIAKWNSILNRCVKQGKDFNLTVSDVKRLMSRKRCCYSRVIMTDGGECDTKRSIDRIDSSKGYVKGNVLACSQRMNSVKGNATLEELETLVRALK